jgi:hypothetical protein
MELETSTIPELMEEIDNLYALIRNKDLQLVGGVLICGQIRTLPTSLGAAAEPAAPHKTRPVRSYAGMGGSGMSEQWYTDATRRPGDDGDLDCIEVSRVMNENVSEVVCRVNIHLGREISRAHLIAAAPELLEALKEIRAELEGRLTVTMKAEQLGKLHLLADSAIAKVEGRQ